MKEAPTEAALVLVPINLKAKLHLQQRAVVIPDLDCHAVIGAVVIVPDRISRHVRQRAGGLFLHAGKAGKFQPFIVRRQIITVPQVEIVACHRRYPREPSPTNAK